MGTGLVEPIAMGSLSVEEAPQPLNPLIQVQNNDQIEAEAQRLEQEAAAQSALIGSLASHVRGVFVEAETHRNTTGITDRLLECARRRKGEYSVDQLAAIRAIGANETFFNITKTKCASAQAWIVEVMAGKEFPFSVDPTPIAELPADAMKTLQEAVVLKFQTRLIQQGIPATPDEVGQFAMAMYDEMMRATAAEAKKKAKRAEKKIQDQLTEGDFNQAFSQFVHHFCTYPTAFLKGPIPRKRKRPVWKGNNLVIEEQIVKEWSAPNPQNIYPAPNAGSVDEGAMCELVNWDAAGLADMRGVEGWSEEAINDVLEELRLGHANMTREFITGEAERARMENRDITQHGGTAAYTVQGIEMWGPVQRMLLAEWAGKPTDATNDSSLLDIVNVHVILIGRHVVRAVENPDPLGQRPYYAASVEPVPDSVWGEAIPELMKDCQDPLNAVLRTKLDNLSLASGPQVAVDVDAAAPNADVESMHPWKIWYYNGRVLQNSTRDPVKFFQPVSNAQELISIAEYYETKADERTRIPKYVHGDSDVSGAGKTASGLSMLMNAAAKGIKLMLGYIDEAIVRRIVWRMYIWNALNEPDPNMACDAQINPRGSLALILRDTIQLRRQEFLNNTNNPNDMVIIGMKGRATVLRAIAEDLDLPVDDIVPSDEELQQQAQNMIAMQQQDEAAPEGKPKAKAKSKAKAKPKPTPPAQAAA